MNNINSKLIKKEVLKREKEIIDWAKKLISYPSENKPPIGLESEAQNFLKNECLKLGLNIDMFSPDEVTGIQNHPSWLPGRNYSKGRKNIVGKWKGDSGGKSILFSGHIDVAPSEATNWKITNPYKPIIKNGKLYGRGSADLKGGLTAAFWAIKLLKEFDFKPKGNILFESVVDEEFAGGNGTLASRLRGYNAEMAILTEPTRMEICPACQGAFLGDLILKGRAGMPYMGYTIPNPIYCLPKFIELFNKWEENWKSTNIHPLFKAKGKELKILLWDINTNIPGEFPQMGTPLITKISWIVWCYPGTEEKEFKKNFISFWKNQIDKDEFLKSFEIDIRFTYHYVRPWETNIENPAVQRFIKNFKDYTGNEPIIEGAPFSCDLAIYGDIGKMPTIIIGPRGGNLHAPDEWVLLEDIITLTGVFSSIIIDWTS